MAAKGTTPNPMIDLLLTRRSVVVKDMEGEGPGGDDLASILAAGHRVPDHGKLGPWRFVLFEGDARAKFGEVLERAYLESGMPPEDDRRQFERERFLRAPVVVAVISSVTPGIKIPEWEQVLAAGAVCQNMLTAATALGYASQWLTEWYAYDAMVGEALGLTENERVAGFIYLGSAKEKPSERKRPPIEDRISRWEG